MPVIDRIKDFQNDLVAIRRDIHAHPEIGFEETRTSAIVADLLETWGITADRSAQSDIIFPTECPSASHDRARRVDCRRGHVGARLRAGRHHR